jgi:IclR family transcriptional regulator, acetate operon repressor
MTACQPDDLEARQAVGAHRVLLALERLAEHPRGVTLDDLARELGAPKSSIHRALGVLQRVGFAEQDRPGGRYRLGLELVRLALRYYEEADEPALVAPALTALASRFGETAHYGRLDDAEIVYVAKVTPPSVDVRMTSAIGGRNPAHCTGVGKALLAYALPDRPAVERYVAQHGPLVARTVHTITAAEALHDELEQVRAQGFAVDREESELGINCIAFPAFLGSPGSPAGAVSVAAILRRTPLAELVAAVPEMRELLAAHGIAAPAGQASSGWVASASTEISSQG